jgi:hypothetical protein
MPEVRIFILLSLGGARTYGHWSCRGECHLGSACFAVGGSHTFFIHLLNYVTPHILSNSGYLWSFNVYV